MINKKKKIIGVLSIFIMYIGVLALIKLSNSVNFSIDIMFFATLLIAYISSHFFFEIKKMYNCLFKHRYFIVGGIFLILVVGGYNGSSMGMWNYYIDPNISVENAEPIIGQSRGIRSDEWLVSTPTTLSQLSDTVDLGKINNLINAKSNDVTFYPRLIQKDYSVILNLASIGYLFLPKNQGFSFAWYFNFFALFLVSIELFMIITKKNKLYSVLGAFLITLAPSVIWWNSCTTQLYGEAALLIIYHFLNFNNKIHKVIMASLLGWIAACYIMLMYPAWQLPYGYFFVILFLYLLYENRDKIKISNICYLFITAAICGILVFPLYIGATDIFAIVTNTVYPGARESYGGGIFGILFDYIANIFFPYSNSVANPCEFSQYISFYPIPLFMGIYYLYKNKKANKELDVFLVFTIVFSILLSIWCIFPLPKVFSKITLMTMSTPIRAQLVLGYASIFMLVYILSKYETLNNCKKTKNKQILLELISIISFVSILLFSNKVINAEYKDSLTIFTNIISIIIFLPLIYLLIINKKRTNLFLTVGMIIITVLSTITINPLSKGLSVFFEKPFSKEIQSLVKNDSNSVFLAVNSGIVLPNYILANGAKTVNSVNFVPNLDLWNELDKTSKYNFVYNRYSHVAVELVNDDTNFELLQVDAMKINLNYNDICITNADYLVSSQELYDNEDYYYEIYHENNMYIYKTKCSESVIK